MRVGLRRRRRLLARRESTCICWVWETPKAARKKGINVYMLGVGNTKGAPIPMEDGSYLQDNTGHTVMTFLNEDMCKEIAQAGKGSYIHVDNTSDAEELLNEDLERLQRGETDTVIYSE